MSGGATECGGWRGAVPVFLSVVPPLSATTVGDPSGLSVFNAQESAREFTRRERVGEREREREREISV